MDDLTTTWWYDAFSLVYFRWYNCLFSQIVYEYWKFIAADDLRTVEGKLMFLFLICLYIFGYATVSHIWYG